MGPDWTRRQMLTRSGTMMAGVAGLGLAAYAGYEWPHAGAPGRVSPAASGTPAPRHFVSEPHLTPPAVTVTRPSPRYAAGTGYILTAPFGRGHQDGLMICDQRGRLAWFRPATTHGDTQMDLNVQSYRGRPVLTWWEGRVVHGVGYGSAFIADSSYTVTHTVRAGHGLRADLHEFAITGQDTALITAVRHRAADLTAIGGPAHGVVLSGVAQEIDIATGAVLFEWDSLDHVPITDTCKEFSGGTARRPFDYFHINSLAVMPDGDLLISSRNTWTIYKVSRPGGHITWRLGGRHSSFTMGPGTRFYWQHHARPHGPGLLSVFDDGSRPPEEPRSRAIFMRLDTVAMRATLLRAYTHPAGLRASAMGDAELLPDGRVFVGWGAEPYFSEFAPGGQLILDGQFPGGSRSYRAYTRSWSGRPAREPAVAARPGPGGGAAVYASWNGATEVASWQVLAGAAASRLTPAGRQERTGFETVIDVTSKGPYFAAAALDARGRELGRSHAVRLG